MPYIRLREHVYDCNQCSTRCDGISKGIYKFENDVSFSEYYELLITQKINASGKYQARKTTTAGFPDLEIKDNSGQLVRLLEVKVQQRTFMQVEKRLPLGALTPSETVALNESDLLRYFSVEKQTGVPVTIVWVLMNRLCILPVNTQRLYYQHLCQLKLIHSLYGDNRRFKRKSGDGDVVDGVHKGVTVNYHFSLNELMQWT
jgi:hypothetical protein